MAVIAIANAKGGAGKTTVAVLLAMEFAQKGEKAVIFDCDPLAFASKWRRQQSPAANISVVSGITFANFGSNLRAHNGISGHVIIDLSSARDALIALAAGLSDLVLIPVQGCAMDALGAAHVLDLIGQVEQNARSRIKHAVVLTRVSSFVTTRAIRSVKILLAQRDVALLDTPIIERSAYRDMFEHGGSLYTMDQTRVSNLAKAQRNMQALAVDVGNFASGKQHLHASGSLARISYTAPGAPVQPAKSHQPSLSGRAAPPIGHGTPVPIADV